MSYAALIMGDETTLKELTRRSVEIIERRCSGTDLRWYAAVGPPTYRLSGLAQCYADTNHVLAYRHLMPDTHVFTADMLAAEREQKGVGRLEELNPEKIEPMVIRNFLQSGTAEETEAFVGEYLSNLGGAEKSLMFRHYILMSIRINAEVVLQQLGCNLEEFSRQLPKAEVNLPVEDVRDYIVSVLKTALHFRDLESQKQSSDIIDSAIHYIDKNYADEKISLNTVAEAVNISTNYLSALFSQKMGISFVEYLTQKRMAKARQLLQKTGLRSSEVAYQVGYRDPRYFSFVFKKTQGCSPRAFRAGETDGE